MFAYVFAVDDDIGDGIGSVKTDKDTLPDPFCWNFYGFQVVAYASEVVFLAAQGIIVPDMGQIDRRSPVAGHLAVAEEAPVSIDVEYLAALCLECRSNDQYENQITFHRLAFLLYKGKNKRN